MVAYECLMGWLLAYVCECGKCVRNNWEACMRTNFTARAQASATRMPFSMCDVTQMMWDYHHITNVRRRCFISSNEMSDQRIHEMNIWQNKSNLFSVRSSKENVITVFLMIQLTAAISDRREQTKSRECDASIGMARICKWWLRTTRGFFPLSPISLGVPLGVILCLRCCLLKNLNITY